MKVLKTLLFMQYYPEQTRPPEKKYGRGNQSPFMNKILSKAIMQRSKLSNLFL